MTVASRNFQSPADLELLHQFIADCWQAYGFEATFHIGDLHWRLRPQHGRHPERHLRLWHNHERLLAFAWFDPPDSGDLQCHPDVDRALLEPELFTWLEEQAKTNGAQSITIGAFQSDCLREKLLQDRGYHQQASFLCHMMQSLDSSVGPVLLPHNCTIDCTTLADLESLANTIALAFGSRLKPVSTYLAMRANPFYRNDLDFIVRSERDGVIAFGIAWLDEQNQVGLLEPVGCHPDHRRQGLASAVITSALEGLRKAGARTAIVYPKGSNSATFALYSKCGFCPVANDYDWELEFEDSNKK